MTNYTTSTPESKGFFSDIAERFSKTRVGKRAGLMLGGAALFGGAANAAGFSSDGFVQSEDSHTTSPNISQDGSFDMMDAGMTTAALGFNAFTASHGVAEKALVKSVGMKAAMKAGGKLIPGLGLALGAKAAASEFDRGNYGRASLEMLSGVASLVPGVGTMASAAIDAGLLLSTDGGESPAGKLDKLETVAKTDASTVGTAGVGHLAASKAVTPEQRAASANILQKLQAGESVQKEELVASGADAKTVATLPEREDGSVDTTQVGSDIKNTASGILMASSRPLSPRTTSAAAASAIASKDQREERNSSGFLNDTPLTHEEYTEGASSLANGIERMANTPTQKVMAGTIRKKLESGSPVSKGELSSAGVSDEAIEMLPIDENGFVNVGMLGREISSSRSASAVQPKVSEVTHASVQESAPQVNEAAVGTFVQIATAATNPQAGAMAIAVNAPAENRAQTYELVMNGGATPAALSSMGVDSGVISQFQSQFPGAGGSIDISALGGALQASTSASIAANKLGMTTVDNADIVNAIGAGQVNLDGLNSIVDQTASSTGVQIQTADGSMMLSRNAQDNVVMGGQAVEGSNYQAFREAMASASPAEQSGFASWMASTPSDQIASAISRRGENWQSTDAWQSDSGHMMDIAQNSKIGNEDARSGFMDITFALEEMGEEMRDMVNTVLEGKI